jgi:hypothetical protein
LGWGWERRTSQPVQPASQPAEDVWRRGALLGGEGEMCLRGRIRDHGWVPQQRPASQPKPFGLVQVRRGQVSSVRLGSVQLSSVRLSSVRFGSVQIGSVQFRSVRFSSDRFSSVQIGSVQFSSVRFGSVQPSPVQSSPVQPSPMSDQQSTAEHASRPSTNKHKQAQTSPQQQR